MLSNALHSSEFSSEIDSSDFDQGNFLHHYVVSRHYQEQQYRHENNFETLDHHYENQLCFQNHQLIDDGYPIHINGYDGLELPSRGDDDRFMQSSDDYDEVPSDDNRVDDTKNGKKSGGNKTILRHMFCLPSNKTT